MNKCHNCTCCKSKRPKTHCYIKQHKNNATALHKLIFHANLHQYLHQHFLFEAYCTFIIRHCFLQDYSSYVHQDPRMSLSNSLTRTRTSFSPNSRILALGQPLSAIICLTRDTINWLIKFKKNLSSSRKINTIRIHRTTSLISINSHTNQMQQLNAREENAVTLRYFKKLIIIMLPVLFSNTLFCNTFFYFSASLLF